jgi:O-antigen/teichoic acid export membrane protein
MNPMTQLDRTGKTTLWRTAWQALRSERTHSRIIGGSVVMLVGSGMVSAINFGYNVAVARLLGPSDFGQAAASVTLLMLVSAITLAFQLVCAKFIAKNEDDGAKSAVYSTLMRRSWYVGVGLGSLLMLCSAPVARYLNMPSPRLVLLLALGVAFYIPLGVKRGGLQGICSFRKLTLNFVLEAGVKFLGAILLIEAGFGVQGAVGAIAASVVVAFFLPFTPSELDQPWKGGLPASFREGIQAIVFFVGQVVINNVDIILVKHFFSDAEAGLYAAIALVGRVLYFFSWSVMSAMFPISAQAKQKEENSSVLVVPLLLVLAISVIFASALGAFPDVVLRTVFGAGFQAAGRGLNSLLMLYAAATGAYSLAVVLMAYEMSRKLANSGWIQLAFSGAIIIGITAFHSTLRQVILVQLVLMVALFIVASVPFFRHKGKFAQASGDVAVMPALAQPPGAGALRRLRRAQEAEVIAEFLKNEFHHAEFARDRSRFLPWVDNPDITNPAENALRRALLFRRRESMWRELPPDTEWWEVEVSAQDLDRIRVFPRAQWRKVASGSFLLRDIVQRVRQYRPSTLSRTSTFISRLQELSQKLRDEDDRSGVLLIGIDESLPLTVIEGNHRVTAAMLASPTVALHRFRYFCGFSPHMNDCCWYQTNLTNLWRYARNRVKVLMYDREAEIARILRHHPPFKTEQSTEPVSAPIATSDDILREQASGIGVLYENREP